MPFITQGKTNWKFLLIVVVLAIVIGGGILGYLWWIGEEETELPEIKPPEKITIISPTNNDTWIAGETYQIRWTPSNPKEMVGIILRDTRIPGASLSKVWQKEQIPNTGIYDFVVPDVSPGDKYKIYISTRDIYGYSNLFSIEKETPKLLLINTENFTVFNLKTVQVEATNTLNNTRLTINCWAGCNETIQTSQDGKIIIFYVGEDPQKSEYESPYMVSKLYLSPNKLIFETDETKGIIFGQWVLTKDGQKIYVAVPREDKSTMDLYQISIPSGNTKEIAKDVGKLVAPLRLDISQKNLLSFFEEEKVENNFHYYYIYATKINLESGLVQKELVIKQNPESFPFFEVDGWAISPDLSRIVDLDGTRDGFWVRMIDLNTHADNKIFKVSGWSNTDFIWSPDSTSFIFALYPSETYEPSQQGIWLYDFRTQKTRILIEKPGPSSYLRRPVQPIGGSFDGQRFLYRTEDSKLHIFNISNNEDEILPIIDLPILAQWIE